MPADRAANRKLSDSRFTKRLRGEEEQEQSGEERAAVRSSYRAEAPSGSSAPMLPDAATLDGNSNVGVSLSIASKLFSRMPGNSRDDSNSNGVNSQSDFSSVLANDELSYSSASVSDMSNSLSRALPLPPLPPVLSSSTSRKGQAAGTTEIPESTDHQRGDAVEIQTLSLHHQSLSTPLWSKEEEVTEEVHVAEKDSSSSDSPRLPSSPSEPFMYYQFQKNTPSPSRSGSLQSSSSRVGGVASVGLVAEEKKPEDNALVSSISRSEKGEEDSKNDAKFIQTKRNTEIREGSGDTMKNNTSAKDDGESTDDEATNEALEAQQRAAVLEALRSEMLQVSNSTKNDNNNEKSDYDEEMAGEKVLPQLEREGCGTKDDKGTEGGYGGVSEELSFGATQDDVCEGVESEVSSEKGRKIVHGVSTEASIKQRDEAGDEMRKGAVLETEGDSRESQEGEDAVRGIHKQDTTDYGFPEGELTQVHRGLLTPLRTIVAAIHAHASVANAAPTTNGSSPSRACIYEDEDDDVNVKKEASKGRAQQKAIAPNNGPLRHSSPSLGATTASSSRDGAAPTDTNHPLGVASSAARTACQHQQEAPEYQPTPRELRAAYAAAHKRLQRLPPHLMRAHIAMAQCKVPMHVRPMATIATYAATAAMGDLVEDFAAIRKAHGYL